MIPNVFIPLFIWGIIQIIKIWIDFTAKKKMSRSAIRSAWGFPSVHSGIAASVCTLMLMQHGLESSEFAISFCFSFLFRYDAANIRYEAWQHATFLNKIQEELENSLYLSEKMIFLKERLWHTFFEVMGGIIVWISLTIITFLALEGGIFMT